jgi:asparagine synthase (glutamine-hydrolysing)
VPPRAVFRADHVGHLLDHPQELTALRDNQLRELGVLELWLQTHGIG